MEKLRRFTQKNWLITMGFCMIAAVIGLEIYDITNSVFEKFISDERIAGTLGRMIASVMVGIVCLFYFKEDRNCLGIRKRGFFRGLFVGGFMILATVSNLYSAFEEASEYVSVNPEIAEILIIGAEALFIGILEEFLFRGLILNVFLLRVKERNYRELMRAVMGSSLIFGAVHLLNLVTYPNLVKATLVQVEYAVFIGMIFAIVYIRSNNIWVVIFLHFIYDFASEVPYAFYKIPDRGTISDYDMATTVAGAVVNLTFLIVALIISRKITENPAKKDVD